MLVLKRTTHNTHRSSVNLRVLASADWQTLRFRHNWLKPLRLNTLIAITFFLHLQKRLDAQHAVLNFLSFKCYFKKTYLSENGFLRPLANRMSEGPFIYFWSSREEENLTDRARWLMLHPDKCPISLLVFYECSSYKGTQDLFLSKFLQIDDK